MRALRFVAATFVVLLTMGIPSAHAVAATAPVKILTIGDSVPLGGVGADPADPTQHYQTTLCNLMSTVAGQTCENDNAAVAGTKCSYWPYRVAALLAQYQPDVVVIACGFNDQLGDTLYGEPATSWSIRYTLIQIHDFRTPPIPTIVVLPHYVDPFVASDSDIAKGPQIEDWLFSNTQIFINAGWPIKFADDQLIPATASYLQADGTHPLPRGYAYMGRIVYDSTAVLMGWPAAPGVLCDLYGHRKGYTRPAFTPCTYA